MARLKALIGLAALGATQAALQDDTDSVGTCAAGDSTCDARASALLQRSSKAKTIHPVSEVQESKTSLSAKFKKPRVSFAESAANEKNRAKLTIEHDFRSKEFRKHFPKYDPSLLSVRTSGDDETGNGQSPFENCYANAVNAIDEFVTNSDLGSSLTAAELEAFKTRFLSELDYLCKHDAGLHNALLMEGEERDSKWVEDCATAAQDEKPAFTAALADSINSADLAYTTEMPDWMVHESTLTMNERCGIDHTSASEAVLIQKGKEYFANRKQTNQLLADELDPCEKWPSCCPIIRKIHNQGQCGSCWVFGALSAVDSRICIAMIGQAYGFDIPTAMLSRTVATACAEGGGCGGGWPTNVYHYMSQSGIPTGGDSGCNPYFGTGEGTDHFDVSGDAPPCMHHCHNNQYSRTMPEDLFQCGDVSSGAIDIYPTNAAGNVDARNNMYQYGSMSLAMNANQAFMGYSGGIFDGGCGTSPTHAISAIGYGTDYFTFLNSWGENWGACSDGLCGGGRFADCVAHSWQIPGPVDRCADGFPMPLPGQGPPTPPPPPTAAPPPAPAPQWEVTGECDRECTTSPTGYRSCCVTSPRYPSNYNSHSECNIGVGFGKIEVVEFATEASYDKMKVNGQEYHGSNGPSGVEATTAIEWKADC